MRKETILILLTILLINCSMTAEKKVIRAKYVLDNEQILTDSQIDSLNTLFKNHETKTTNQIVLVTTPDFGEHRDIVEYSVNFGNSHGVGQKYKDNGVVIVFSKAKQSVFIATGYGTENFLRDEIAKRIVDNIMLPKFREGDIFGGLYAGSKEIVEFLERPENRMD
jgi:uncharacterized protein